MTKWTDRRATEVLRWVLGLAVLIQACLFLRATIIQMQAAHASGGVIGPHHLILLTLAGVEIVATILFLAPIVNVVGAYLLLAVFAFAILFHFLRGEFEVSNLAVYAAIALVWLKRHPDAKASFSDER
jgi:hypothetical protein